jgi:hypothetical protein
MSFSFDGCAFCAFGGVSYLCGDVVRRHRGLQANQSGGLQLLQELEADVADALLCVRWPRLHITVVSAFEVP